MEGFALRDGVYASSMSDGEALLLRQLATEVLVGLDDPGEYAATSSMVNAATETEQRRDEPRERTLRMLLPSMSEDDEDAGRLRALTEDSLRTDKSVRLRAIVGDLAVAHGQDFTLVGFFGGIFRQHDAGGGFALVVEALDDDTVMQRAPFPSVRS